MAGRLSRLGFLRLALALVMVAGVGLSIAAIGVDQAQPQRRAAKPQAIDQEYTAKIKEFTQDPRILTELVDHLPASATVPSPLKFLGRVAGTPDELDEILRCLPVALVDGRLRRAPGCAAASVGSD